MSSLQHAAAAEEGEWFADSVMFDGQRCANSAVSSSFWASLRIQLVIEAKNVGDLLERDTTC